MMLQNPVAPGVLYCKAGGLAASAGPGGQGRLETSENVKIPGEFMVVAVAQPNPGRNARRHVQKKL